MKKAKTKRKGPKPRHGAGNPCRRQSISIPNELWDWCQRRAEMEGFSVSEFIVNYLKGAQKWDA